jgi:valyl-tRNA synthetase
MIFSGLEHMGRSRSTPCSVPRPVRDAQGRKMSKSLGNGIDPLEVIDRVRRGRAALHAVTGNSPGNDMRFYGGEGGGERATLRTRSGTPRALS